MCVCVFTEIGQSASRKQEMIDVCVYESLLEVGELDTTLVCSDSLELK